MFVLHLDFLCISKREGEIDRIIYYMLHMNVSSDSLMILTPLPVCGSLLFSSAESLMVVVLYTWVWLTSVQASHWPPLINLCVTLLPHSIWLTSIITWQTFGIDGNLVIEKTLTPFRDHKHKLCSVQAGSHLALAIGQECAIFKVSAVIPTVHVHTQ